MLIKEYQASWANDFMAIKNIIQQALAPLIIPIEHVGSTSVVGLAAKPIIDIDMVYENEADFSTIKKNLEQLGYYHNGDQGIKDREVFKRVESAKKHPVLDTIIHHLYLCPVHSVELQRHLAFRDYLRENSEARQEYGQLKYRIAERAEQDMMTYAYLKQTMARSFVESILAKAKM